MIQRIQSVYLLLAVGVVVSALCLPLGSFINADAITVQAFKPLGVTLADGSLMSTWGLFALLVLSAVVSACTIFLFRNRRLQMRMTVFNVVLLIGYYIVFFFFLFALKDNLNSTFQFSWALCLPLIAIILDWLAFVAIRHDDEMVKAADRIR